MSHCFCWFVFWAGDVVPVFTAVTAVWLLITVAEFNMISQRWRRGTSHVTEWAFVVADCTKPPKTMIKFNDQCNHRGVCWKSLKHSHRQESAWEHQLGKNVLFWSTAQLIRGNKLFPSSVLTVCSHVVSKKPFCSKTFGAVRTLEPLTYRMNKHNRTLEGNSIKWQIIYGSWKRFCLTFHVFLPNHVVKQFGVVGVHPPTAWTSNYLLLSVAAEVLS